MYFTAQSLCPFFNFSNRANVPGGNDLILINKENADFAGVYYFFDLVLSKIAVYS
jgi:hypothetical protein